MSISKVASKKFAAVSSSSLLVLVNEIAGVGMDRWTTLGILGLAGVYAVCQAMVDVALVKAGKKSA